ncbi:MAG: TRAP transporter small permease [Hyphomicrobiales bacterium]|nr:TRAP transporter small permease [Hyphomicrobiales bacterium]
MRDMIRGYEDTIAVLVLVATFIVVVVSVFFRYVLNDSLIWAEEFARFGLVAITFVATGLGFRKDSHIRVDLVDRLPGPVARTIRLFVLLISLAVVGFLALQAVRIMPILSNSRSAAMEMPISWLYAVVAAGLAGGGVRIVVEVVSLARKGIFR